jgi:hypothetical protein
MSYFYTQAHVQLEPPRGIGRVHAQAEGGIPNQRDANITREIDNMAKHPGKLAELLERKQAAPRGIRIVPVPGYTGDNVIREPAKPRPMLRVIPDRSDDELRSLLPAKNDEQLRREAQQRMMQSPGYIYKMTGHSTSPLTKPMPPHPVGVKPMQLPDTGANVAPDGLKGMGRHCEEPKMYGRRAPNTQQKTDYVPEYVPHRRTHGVKAHIAPPDTLVLG